MSASVGYHAAYQQLSNAKVFYRTAGDPSKPTILLLHGFPTSSHYFRNLIPILAAPGTHHIVAPDYPGYGFTTVEEGYQWTFSDLTKTLAEFLDALSIKSFVVYIFDFGAPIGLRLALERPNAIKGLVVQSGNAYVEGFGDLLKPLTKYWETNSEEDRDWIRNNFLTYDMTKWTYEDGTPNKEAILPESYTLDFYLLARDKERHCDLLKDYETNVALYEDFHKWFREHQVPVLIAWGKNDAHFIPAGAEAYKKDFPDADLHFLNAGHFAVETNYEEIGSLVVEFLKKQKL